MVVSNKNAVYSRNYVCSYIKSKKHDNIGGVGPLNFQGETCLIHCLKLIIKLFYIFNQWDTKTNIIMASGL